MAVNDTSRMVSVLLKDHRHEPVTFDDQETARTALSQIAEEDGLMLVGPVYLTGSGYSATDRIHVAAYECWATRPPGPTIPLTTRANAGKPGTSTVRAGADLLHAHRGALHAMQVVVSAVERALETREPLAALVAAHLLMLPVQSNDQVTRTHIYLTSIFPDTPKSPDTR